MQVKPSNGLALRKFVTGLTLLAMTSAASAQALWQKASLGMTPEEVVKLIPGAKLDKGVAKSGNSCIVNIPEAKIAGTTFDICFQFIPDRLSRVIMRQPNEYVPNATTQKAFIAVATELSRLYGKEEILKPLESRHAGLFGEWGWRQGSTRVELSVTPTTQATSGLVVFIKAN